MSVKKLDHYVERILRFWNICVVEESVKQTFPNVEFCFHAYVHHLLVSVESGAQLKAASAGNNQSRRELPQYVWRTNWGDQRVLRVSIGEITERGSCSWFHGRS